MFSVSIGLRLLCTPLFVLKGINALISTTETYIVSELGNSLPVKYGFMNC